MFSSPSITFLVLFFLCLPVSANAQETPANRVQHFIDKILNEKFGDRFGLNQSGQFGVLSKRLINLIKIAECDCEKANNEESRPLPWVDADMFFDRWDTPTACSVKTTTPVAGGLSISMDCIWGKNKDHQPGSKMQVLVKLVKEGVHWNIDNVIHGQQEDGASTKTDLIQRVTQAGNQSTDPAVCKKAFGVNAAPFL